MTRMPVTSRSRCSTAGNPAIDDDWAWSTRRSASDEDG